jgi:hypothetical protein
MERVQKALTNNNFLLFLASKNIYTNGLTYYENLLLWISKVSNGLTQFLSQIIININIYFLLVILLLVKISNTLIIIIINIKILKFKN